MDFLLNAYFLLGQCQIRFPILYIRTYFLFGEKKHRKYRSDAENHLNERIDASVGTPFAKMSYHKRFGCHIVMRNEER